jgi:hypothetical protein
LTFAPNQVIKGWTEAMQLMKGKIQIGVNRAKKTVTKYSCPQHFVSFFYLQKVQSGNSTFRRNLDTVTVEPEVPFLEALF